jgi:hypothetical protein
MQRGSSLWPRGIVHEYQMRAVTIAQVHGSAAGRRRLVHALQGLRLVEKKEKG